MPNWFVVTAGREIGPFTSRQLKSLVRDGKLAPTDLVRREDRLIQCRAGVIKGLFEGKPSPPALPPARIVLDLPPASSGTRSARISLNGTPAGVVGGENADLLSFEVPPGAHVLDMQGAGLSGKGTILASSGQTQKYHVVFTRRGIHLSGEDAPRTRSLF